VISQHSTSVATSHHTADDCAVPAMRCAVDQAWRHAALCRVAPFVKCFHLVCQNDVTCSDIPCCALPCCAVSQGHHSGAGHAPGAAGHPQWRLYTPGGSSDEDRGASCCSVTRQGRGGGAFCYVCGGYALLVAAEMKTGGPAATQ
jgi:hypothetical protein